MTDPVPAKPIGPVRIEGRYTVLEPLTRRHAEDLYAAIAGEGIEDRHRYLGETPPHSSEVLAQWIDRAAAIRDPYFLAVIDRATGRCGGRQAFMRIKPEHRSLELGSILWGRGVARTRIATEAVYLAARHAFEELGYLRFEWKCDDANLPSKRAAIRFGFTWEGLFRKHMVRRANNRDTAWFAIVDTDWPALKARYGAWLDPANFDESGQERTSLATPRLERADQLRPAVFEGPLPG